MKTPDEGNSVLFFALLMVLMFTNSCTTHNPTSDPLMGWTFRPFDDFAPPHDQHHYQLDKTITDDYERFLKEKELHLIGAVTGFYDDQAGHVAVQFEAMKRKEHESWRYVITYDGRGRRVSVVRYVRHRYRS